MYLFVCIYIYVFQNQVSQIPIFTSQALAVLEQWHYSVYDESQNICYFGIMKTENVMVIALDDENPRQVSINTDQLDQFVQDYNKKW